MLIKSFALATATALGLGASAGPAAAQMTTGGGGYRTPGGMSTGALYGGGSLAGSYYNSPAYYATPYRSPYSTMSYGAPSYSPGGRTAGGYPAGYAIAPGSELSGRLPVRPLDTEFYIVPGQGLSMPGVYGPAADPALGLGYYTGPSARRWWWR
jgi:hypothetical protein